MQFVLLFALMLISQPNSPARSSNTTYAPLWLYQGTWHISRKSGGPGAKPDELVNQCALIGKYFVCQQSVNGQPGNLLIFIPAGQQGHYYTQTVMPEGRAAGRGDLEISGDRWTYSSRWPQANGTTIHYQTTNVFTGNDRIHFEQAESTDGEHWSIKDSGDEVRVTKRSR